MAEFSYDITEKIAVLSEGSRGWTKELNRVSWNGREPKYDLRDWCHDEGKMGKGVTLSDDEMKNLFEALEKRGL